MNKKIFYGVFVLLIIGLFVISGCAKSAVSGQINTDQPQIKLNDGCEIVKTPEFNELIEKGILEVTSTGLIFSAGTTMTINNNEAYIENPRIESLIVVKCDCTGGSSCGRTGGGALVCGDVLCPKGETCKMTTTIAK